MRTLLIGFALTLGLVAVAPAMRAEGAEPTTSDVKSAFIVNFMKFVEWPGGAFKTPHDDMVMGIVGADPFDRVLDAMVAGKTINGRGVRVRRMGVKDEMDGLHLLFISASERGRLAQILQRVSTEHVLTVSDIDGFCKAGGMIELVLDDDRLRFEVNLAATKRLNLQVSSRLLALAKAVLNEKQP
jgi:hypothetical protein